MDPASIATFPDSIGSARFQRYLDRYPGRNDLAARLYLWNLEVAGAYWGPISLLEVALRNAVHDRMKLGRSDEWWLTTQLAPYEAAALTRTIDKVFNRKGTLMCADDVVAATSFGFWVGMLSGGIARDPQFDYETRFWQTRLVHAFPGLPYGKRKYFHGELLQVQQLRNRIAHHEPVYHFNHTVMIGRIVELASYVNSDLSDYINRAERVTGAVARMPDAVSRGDCIL
ncbi:hypothetical protein [Agromyces cerinus]|uniref:Abi-like protein n=1 Tax=Agromyces cerinus subsp. cerinus TaxID=232089 RepID=A0A1N6F9X1_9MICO|nr:hypothetical protein [Agromyces cerinus]SIN92081.1 hypothetical protein SAMN05443544_1872 [Agromyces cerinus subsp. cerinus]